MTATIETRESTAGGRRAGWVLGGLGVLFLAVDALMKLLALPAVIQSMTELGYPTAIARPLGLIELACLIVYLAPRTAPLGAVLWTGYLGGAVATHVRLGNPLLTHTLFPIYVAALLWGGLYLRDARVRGLLRR